MTSTDALEAIAYWKSITPEYLHKYADEYVAMAEHLEQQGTPYWSHFTSKSLIITDVQMYAEYTYATDQRLATTEGASLLN